jgi:hypothetical protein
MVAYLGAFTAYYRDQIADSWVIQIFIIGEKLFTIGNSFK